MSDEEHGQLHVGLSNLLEALLKGVVNLVTVDTHLATALGSIPLASHHYNL